MKARHWIVRAASGLAIGAMGGGANAQAVSLEVVADQSIYAVTDEISLMVFAEWSDAQVGTKPGVMSALADFNFRLEVGAGISPVSVDFHPMLNGNVDTMDLSGVEISGFQLPPFFGLPLDHANPILIATITCEAFEGGIFNVASLEMTTAPSFSVYIDELGTFQRYEATIGQKDILVIPAELIVSGGPCCDEDPCNGADLAEPYGQLNFDDVVVFLGAFSSGLLEADLAAPFGSYDFSDIAAFLGLFGQGCP